MVRKCCVADCSSNYDAALRGGITATSTFKFPDDPAIYDNWVRAIRRPNWVPSKRSSVCIHHFKPDDIVKYDKPAKIRPDAVPCLFGEAILQGRSAVPARRGRPRKVKCPAANHNESIFLEKLEEKDKHFNTISCAKHVIEDCILGFENFKTYVRERLQNNQWIVFLKPEVVHLFSLDDSDDRYPIRINNSIKVYADLKMKLYTGEEEQTDENLQWILGLDKKLLRWSQLYTIVNKYSDASRHKVAHDELLENTQKNATAFSEGEECEATFLEERLDDTQEENEMYDLETTNGRAINTGTTMKLKIEKQLGSELNDDFIDIDFIHSENSYTIAEPPKSGLNDSTNQPIISKRKPVLSTVRELQRTKYKCFVCNIDHGTRDEYEQHMPTHISLLPYHCTSCIKEKVTIKTLASLNKHFLMHRKPLKCRCCDVRFTTYASRVLHERCKHSSNSTAITCDVCQNEFSSTRTYRYHRKIHDDPEALRCKVCHRSLSSTYEVKMHMRTHTGEKPNKCFFCKMSFNRRSNLTEHIRRYHSMERPFDCGVCGDSFRTNVKLKNHMVSHEVNTDQDAKPPKRVSSSSKVLQCKDCDRKFVSRVSYHSHRRQHDKRYQCSYCGILISQLRDFVDHENIHTGVRPYTCTTCGKTFRTSSTYYGHLLVHGREKRHFCKICNKGFLRSQNVKVHMRTHTREKPFRCDSCGKNYADKTAYNRHQLTHHPTGGDKLSASEIVRLNVAPASMLPLVSAEPIEVFDSSISEQMVHQMGLEFSTATLLPAAGDSIGGLPHIMPNILDGECPVVFEFLSGNSCLTHLPQMITPGDGPTVTSADLQ